MKSLIFLLCFLVIGISVVGAVELLNEAAQDTNTSGDEATSLREVGSTAESSFEQPIVFSGKLRKYVNTIFHFSSEEPINLHLLILLISILGVVILILQQFMALVPFLAERWRSFSAAIIITLIASVAGTVRMSALYLQDIGKSVQFLGKSGLLSLFVIVVVLIFVYYAVSKALVKFQQSGRVSSAEQIGFDAGFHHS